jgi:ribosomal protein S4
MFEDRQFRKLFRKSVKSDGDYDTQYCYLLEGRIPSMFHRMNFTTNLLTAYKNLKKKRIIVDFKQIFSPNYLLPMGKLLSITKK